MKVEAQTSNVERLPAGRHGIPESFVVAHQRKRLLDATCAIIAERGYAELTVGHIAERACVSRATFYKLFPGKHECVLAAQESAFERLHKVIVDALESRPGWPEGVAAAVDVTLDLVGKYPGEARLVLASSHAPSEPRLDRDGLAGHQQLIALLREGSHRFPPARSPGGVAEQAAVGAAMSIVGTCLAAGEVDALEGLKPELVQILLAPYLGVHEARRVALAA